MPMISSRFSGASMPDMALAHFIDRIVNDVVVAKVDAVVLGKLLGALLGAHIEADDHGLARRSPS